MNTRCNNNCGFCDYAINEAPDGAREIEMRLSEGIGLGKSKLWIYGMEPAIHPEFMDIVLTAAGAGYGQIGVETNGRIFAYDWFAREFKRRGGTHVSALYFSHNRNLYEQIAGAPGGFEQFTRGLANILERGRFSASARIVVCSKNARFIEEITLAAKRLPFKHVSYVRGKRPEAGFENDERFDVSYEEQRMNIARLSDFADGGGHMATITINNACNQNCLFCWNDRSREGSPSYDVAATMMESLDYGSISEIVFTGGEPTLNKELFKYLKLAAGKGVKALSAQTNGVMCCDGEFVSRLVESGLSSAVVSLHSHRRRISEKITSCPGSFEKTMRGIANLRERNVNVRVMHVICKDNYRDLPLFAKFAAGKLKGCLIIFSVASPIHLHSAELINSIATFDVIAAPLKEALDICLEKKVDFITTVGPCGIPLCALGGEMKYYPRFEAQTSIKDGAMFHPDACESCGVSGVCPGIRANYYVLFGEAGLRPV